MVVFEYRRIGETETTYEPINSEALTIEFNNPNFGPAISSSTTHFSSYFDIQKTPVTKVKFVTNPGFVGFLTAGGASVSDYLEFSNLDNDGQGLNISIETYNSSDTKVARLLATRLSLSFWHFGGFHPGTVAAFTGTRLGTTIDTTEYGGYSPMASFEVNGERYKVFEELTYKVSNDMNFYFNSSNQLFAPEYLGVRIPWNYLSLPSYMKPNEQLPNSNYTRKDLFTGWSSSTLNGSTWLSQAYVLEFDLWDRSGRDLSSMTGSIIHYKPGEQMILADGTGRKSTNFKLKAYFNYTGVSRFASFGDTSPITSGQYVMARSYQDGGERRSAKYNALGDRYWKLYGVIANNKSYVDATGSTYPAFGHPASDADINTTVVKDALRRSTPRRGIGAPDG